MTEPLNLKDATEKALDYAATHCRTCASGTLRCQRHADEDGFLADALEKFGDVCQQQVYETTTDSNQDAITDYREELRCELEDKFGKLPEELRRQVLKILKETL